MLRVALHVRSAFVAAAVMTAGCAGLRDTEPGSSDGAAGADGRAGGAGGGFGGTGAGGTGAGSAGTPAGTGGFSGNPGTGGTGPVAVGSGGGLGHGGQGGAGEPSARHALAVEVKGNGVGSVEGPAGLSCPGTCEVEIPEGTTVMLTARPGAGTTFGSWAGSCEGMSTASCSFTMDRSRVVTASFNGPGAPEWKASSGNVLEIAERNGQVFTIATLQGPEQVDGMAALPDRRDVVISRFDLATGQRGWVRRLRSVQDGTAAQAIAGLTLDAQGEVLVSGYMRRSTDFGGTTLSLAGNDGTYLARYAAASGSLLGARPGPGGHYASSSADGSHIVVGSFGRYNYYRSLDQVTPLPLVVHNTRQAAVLPDGRTVLCGDFYNTLDLGGHRLTSGGDADAFVARMGTDGRSQWAVRFSGPGYGACRDVKVDSRGDVYAVGIFDQSMTVGRETRTSVGENDTFVAKLSGADGALIWLRIVGGTADDVGNAVAPAPGGDVYLTGSGHIKFGLTETAGGAYVARLAGSDGAYVWVTTVESSSWPFAMEVASNGRVLVGGDELLSLTP